MTLDSIIILATAIFILTIKPGPGMMLVISHTLSQGIKGCLGVLFGAQLINMIFISIVFLGFYTIDVDMIFISICVKAAAAVYLIWMGVQGLKEADNYFEPHELDRQGFGDSMLASMALTASNPLVIVFYAGIFPTILDVNAMSIQDVGTVIAVIVMVEAGTAFAYCLPFAFFRYKMSKSFIRKINIFSSIIIILIGFYIGYTALPAEHLLNVF